MSRQCKSCLKNAPLKDSDPDQYKIWRAGHHLNCNLNYVGSAPNMECTGAVKMFERSLQNYGLRYLKFYGDGDSKGFNTVESIYEGVKIAKLECIEHYQKRVGDRLRKLKKRVKGLGGQAKQKEGGKVTKTKVKARSRLTDALIDKLQNYFGIALRSSAKTVPELKKALLASLFHVMSSEGNDFHSYCPVGADSWCQHQRDIVNKTNLYKPGAGITPDVIKEIKPIYAGLTKDDDLAKCLHGITQNANESLNALFWQRVPKNIYCGIDKLQLAVYDPVAVFNYGRQASFYIYKLLNITPGTFCTNSCRTINKQRKKSALYKCRESTERRRKIIRGGKKRKDDSHVLQEGKTYQPGGFN